MIRLEQGLNQLLLWLSPNQTVNNEGGVILIRLSQIQQIRLQMLDFGDTDCDLGDAGQLLIFYSD